MISLDEYLFLYFNGLHHRFFDNVMWWVSDFKTWIPLFVYWIYLLYQKNNQQFLTALFSIILIVTLADQISSKIFKPYFQRLRPSHETRLSQKIHLLEEKKGQLYKGGKYGFVSSHAANAFGVTFFLFLYLKNYLSFVWFFWAFLVSYSRIYLGVHYPSDILAGAMLGIIISYIVFFIFKRFQFLKIEY
ncbi:MAG: phosphatase PAP2 family protein [Bacteroidetes bacterium]|nr:MAG: phosphatase PAP2 family protein [Bacteroidota bacterium]TAG85495.1 MAG: phosphatase PAP2 family protein [Bacteroidota bacterium]